MAHRGDVAVAERGRRRRRRAGGVEVQFRPTERKERGDDVAASRTSPSSRGGRGRRGRGVRKLSRARAGPWRSGIDVPLLCRFPQTPKFRDRERDLRGETAAAERKEEEDIGFERGAAGLVLWRGKEGAGPSWRWRRAPRSSAFGVETVMSTPLRWGRRGRVGWGRRWTGPPVGWSGLPPPHDFLFSIFFFLFFCKKEKRRKEGTFGV